eukprot:NODE_513_length_1655_cov_27.582192_g425_i0.p1 GENE.NODE_513_length_1655_cov_27.582192_g425_i0~~NODE_513_length_1655_cov_27.582192_g425_i0.p1  ORF type:complete len:103 (-),score=9.32 NODE_513_length_1655_cov_27.582192_g425_i0:1290-1598(-)
MPLIAREGLGFRWKGACRPRLSLINSEITDKMQLPFLALDASQGFWNCLIFVGLNRRMWRHMLPRQSGEQLGEKDKGSCVVSGGSVGKLENLSQRIMFCVSC